MQNPERLMVTHPFNPVYLIPLVEVVGGTKTKGNFIKSRLSQMIIFILNFNLLRKLLLKEKPDFLIAHLIISLPLILFFFFKFETKLIIRISGTPKLNKFRRFFWSLLGKRTWIKTVVIFILFYILNLFIYL